MNRDKREVASTEQTLPSLLLAARGLMPAATNLSSDGLSDMRGSANALDDFVQVLDIDLTKGEGGLGFSVVDHATTPGIFVAHVVDDSAAKRAGLRVNDEIRTVNDESLEQVDQITAAVILRSLPVGGVSLQIRRSRDVMVIRTLDQILVSLKDRTFVPVAKSPVAESNKMNGFQVGPEYKPGVTYAPKSGGGSEDDLTDVADAEVAEDGAPVKGPSPAAAAGPSLLEQQRLAFQRIFTNRDLFPQSTQTRFKGCLFQSLFVMQILLGLTVAALEAAAAGSFPTLIFGAEYAGIYVGLFAVIAGSIGLWTCIIRVKVEKEQMFYWLNLALQSVCCINSICLMGAGVALFLKHKEERREMQKHNAEYPNMQKLIALKMAAFVIHIFLIIIALILFALIVYRRRRTFTASSDDK